MSKINTIFLDIGGTLVTSSDIFRDMAVALTKDSEKIRKINVYLKTEFNKLFANKDPKKFITITNMLEIVLKKAHRKFGVINISNRAMEFHKNSFINNGSLYDETIEVLTELKKRNIILIAVTDSDRAVMLPELKHFTLDHFFDYLIISSEVKAYKPSEPLVKSVLTLFKKPAALFVCDSDVDIATARNIGCRSVVIDRKGSRKLRITPDYKINSLRELITIIDSL